MASIPPAKTRRPNLRSSSFHGGSYLQDHEQYKPIQNNVTGLSIDGILKSSTPTDLPIRNKPRGPMDSITRLSPNPAPPGGMLIRESGIVHSMSHQNCQPSPADPPKLVATLFYNSSRPVHPMIHPDRSPNLSQLPTPTVTAGAAPTLDLNKYPLEPPAPEPEPLDHLYGAFVSQICLTHFLSVLDSFPLPQGTHLESSHRCLAPDPTTPRIMEVTFSPAPKPSLLSFSELAKHEAIYRFEREWNVEVIFQKENVFRRHKRLVVFDMDSTLIQQEVIDEIASFIGVEKEVSAITKRAMDGELDFASSLKARVSLLKGVPADVFEQLKSRITIAPGAVELCKVLKRLGFTMAVLSGGFQPLAEWLAGILGLDYAFANHLLVDPETNTLKGELDPSKPIVHAEHKRNLLLSLAQEKGISLSQTMAVGDGANDIPMLKTAGLGVAWKAKTKVQMEAPARLNVGESLLDLVYLLGLTKSEVDELLAE